MDAAVETSEVTNKPTVVEAVVDGEAVPKLEEGVPASEATPVDTTIAETTATKPEPTAGETNGVSATADLGQNRLFVGCVPYQFSEDDLKAYFEPVRLNSAPSTFEWES